MEKLVTTLMRGGVTPDQIGVITPYEGQRAHTVTTMLRVGACQWFPHCIWNAHHPLRGPPPPHRHPHAPGGAPLHIIVTNAAAQETRKSLA